MKRWKLTRTGMQHIKEQLNHGIPNKMKKKTENERKKENRKLT